VLELTRSSLLRKVQSVTRDGGVKYYFQKADLEQKIHEVGKYLMIYFIASLLTVQHCINDRVYLLRSNI
jgi:hypothetical protein